MVDVLLLGLFITIILIVGTQFIGSEELRAQQGREDTLYTQTQLITLLNYRSDDWNNATAAAMIDDVVCNNISLVETSSCSYDYNSNNFYWTLQNVLNLTDRSDYNYILYVSSNAFDNTTGAFRNFTICNKQMSVCQKNIQPATTHHTCSNGVAVDYALGIWPAWQELPAMC